MLYFLFHFSSQLFDAVNFLVLGFGDTVEVAVINHDKNLVAFLQTVGSRNQAKCCDGELENERGTIHWACGN